METAKLVTILGPTASGKTAMGIKAAHEFGGEIICADSRTVYRGMNIGTAKPTPEEQSDVTHHLLDIANPDELLSAAEFKKRAYGAIEDIRSRGNIPIMVGGSGMYIDSVLYDYSFRSDISAAEKSALEGLSLVELQSIAKEKYPEKFSEIDVKNRRRVEQLISKGPSKDSDREVNKVNSLVMGIRVEMPVLKQNIAVRTKRMLNKGFIQEVEKLRLEYGDCDILKTTTGYAEILDYLDQKIDLDKLEEAINSSTWRLVKKQLTWFKRNDAIHWVHNYKEASTMITAYLETYNNS